MTDLHDLAHVRYLVDDVEAEVARLQAAGVPLRNRVVRGPGGAQVLDRRRRQPARGGELVGGPQGEPGRVQRRVEGAVAARDRAGRGVLDHLAEPEVLEEVARVHLRHGAGA